ncbi:uncharacterized protein [Ciconia boyciana]|uniref:uncharacterized protein isoform X3 n=1 Tax=Ciconia boyciana TaxID=52775 RepID=UPI003B9F0FA4
MDKEDKSIQQMSEPLSSPSAGHLMDMGPNEKYFKHMKQTSGEREKRIKLNAGRSRREQAKEVVTPQCLLSVCLCVCTKGPLVPAYLLGKLAPKESKVSFGISSCLSSRLQGNLTICPPGIEKLSSLLKNEEVVTPSVCAHCLLSFHWIPLRRVWLYLLYTHRISNGRMFTLSCWIYLKQLKSEEEIKFLDTHES